MIQGVVLVKNGLERVKTVLRNGSGELQEAQELASGYQTGIKTAWGLEKLSVSEYKAMLNVVNLVSGASRAK